jgi:murein DD-endopeptidase MepM/ murein hydrolase activator NlpD
MEKSDILAHSQLHAVRPSHLHRLLWAGTALGILAVATAIAMAPSDTRVPSELVVVEQLHLESSKALTDDGPGYLAEERIRLGETLGSLLSRLGVRDPDALAYFRTEPEARVIGAQLAPWKSVSARTTASGELLDLHFPLNDRENALVVTNQDGRLTTKRVGERFERVTVAKSGEIRSSLFAATDAIGIPDSITMQLVEIFSGDIDFHRDLRKGDRFVVSYELDYSRGQPVRSGKVLGAEFTNDGKVYRAIWFEHAGNGGYYAEDGKPLKKEFLRSPLEFSRITSGFSRRFHPILKQWRAHNGVDYGAPAGTKVRATADSTVNFAGVQRGYGNIVILKHSGKRTTAYAHLRGFAKGIRKGRRVSQGEIIGYVGSTGWATGPHLHYEFRINGTPTNPLATKMATASTLAPVQLGLFRDQTSVVTQHIDMLSQAASPLIK